MLTVDFICRMVHALMTCIVQSCRGQYRQPGGRTLYGGVRKPARRRNVPQPVYGHADHDHTAGHLASLHAPSDIDSPEDQDLNHWSDRRLHLRCGQNRPSGATGPRTVPAVVQWQHGADLGVPARLVRTGTCGGSGGRGVLHYRFRRFHWSRWVWQSNTDL